MHGLKIEGLEQHNIPCQNPTFEPTHLGSPVPDDLKLYCAHHTFGTVTMAESKDPSLVRDTMGHEDLEDNDGIHAPAVGRIKSIIDRRNEQKFLM